MKAEPVGFPNEEDLKNKILVPYIQSLGFTSDEIQYEHSFYVKLGHGRAEVGKRPGMGGRADILCQSREK